MLFFHGIDMLREHTEPQFRIHGIVTDGGVAPNIVPERAAANFWIRHLIDKTPVGDMSPKKAKKKLEAKVAQIDNIAKGAALATGTTVDIVHFAECIPGVSVGAMNDIAFQYAVDYGGINIGERPMPKAWEEGGHASLLIPGVSPDIAVEGITSTAGHSQENADITISPEGHKSAVLTAKVMAATHLRLLMDPELRKKVKKEHAMWVKKYNEE
jgi:metal-dependent amidase/aminoacylase/carboxypeptidase family protein